MYLVLIERNEPMRVVHKMKERGFIAEVCSLGDGIADEIVLRREAGGEVLYVARFIRAE